MHRIGRTGRAGKTGIAVTLVDWDELPAGRWSATSSGWASTSLPRRTPRPSTCIRTWTSRTTATGRLPLARRTRAGLAAEYVDNDGDLGGRNKRRRTRNGEREEPATPVRERKPRVRTRGARAGSGTDTAVDAVATAVLPAEGAPTATDAPTDRPRVGPTAEGTKPRRRRRRGGTRRRGTAQPIGDVDADTPDAAAS